MDLRLVLFAPVFAAAYLANEWSVSKWSPCSASCGGGLQRREVFCGASQYKSEHAGITPYECWHARRPASARPCNNHSCPSWVTGPWTQCSATCDKGWQFRQVRCKTAQQDFPPEACSKDKPSHKQPCYASFNCRKNDENDLHNLRIGDRLYSDGRSKPSGGSNYMRSYGRGPLNIGDAKPRWLPDRWQDCSATCGKGMQNREVKCRVLEPFTRQWKEMDEVNCIESDGPKPPDLRPCELKECPISEEQGQHYLVKPPKPEPTRPSGPEFQWSFGDWKPCGATCLAGVQHQALLCIQVSTRKEYSWNYCNAKQRPVSPTRKCNAGPCPSSWKKELWQPCPVTCGRGTQQRRVWCAQRTNNSYGQIFEERIDDGRCEQTRPVSWQYCAEKDCPAAWVTGPWSPCTKTCGEGEQRRQVLCSKTFGNGTKANLYGPESKECRKVPKPASLMICANTNCNGKSTSTGRKGGKGRGRTRPGVINFKAWGEATVYENRPIKIRCPIPANQNYKPEDIVWKHNEQVVKPSRHLKISNRGKLRIFRFKQRYAGIYSCYLDGRRIGAINLSLKKNPHDQQKNAKTNNRYLYSIGNSKPTNSKVQVLPQPEAYKQSKPTDQAGDGGPPSSRYEVLQPMQDNTAYAFRWVAGKWSPCPQTCGNIPTMQIRNVVCVTRVGNRTQTVRDQHCVERRLTKPHGVKVCGEGPCPSWTPGEWSNCATSRCSRYLTAVQSRELFCTFPNNTVATRSHCNRRTRPRMRKTCTNSNCTAEWRETQWSQCTKSCGTGVQMRTIGCYWRGTEKPARNACEGNKRPAIIRTCNEHSCASALSTCTDKSRYCSIVAIMRKCNQMQYREKCCLTCYDAPRS